MNLDDLADEELVLGKSHQRQAGAAPGQGAFATTVKAACEADLYLFAKIILGRTYLTESLHHGLARFLQQLWMHLLLLVPRNHGKTSIGSHALPLHAYVQPKESNLYFPGQPGDETRLLLIQQTERRCQDAIKIVKAELVTNKRLRAFWPHLCWEKPRRDAAKWNDSEFVLPGNKHPDPSLRGVGIGGAVAGSHPSGIIRDDPIAEKEANSDLEMANAVDYQHTVRALITEAWQREWTLATRWKADDMYATELLTDPLVRREVRQIVEDGVCIWPERYTVTDADADAWNSQFPGEPQRWKRSVESLKREAGVYFPLFYLNQPTDESLTDFRSSELRAYDVAPDGTLLFAEDSRDDRLATVQVQVPGDRVARDQAPFRSPFAAAGDRDGYDPRSPRVQGRGLYRLRFR